MGIQECGAKYSDAGATGHDLLDTEALGKTLKLTKTSNVNSKVLGGYKVTYDCADFAGNKARRQVRRVKVVDTTKPRISLIGPKVQVVHAGTKVNQIKDKGVRTSDRCDKNLNDRKVGTYMRTYSVKDASGNKAEITRTFV